MLGACRGSEEEALAKSSYSSPHHVSQEHPICISAGILEHSKGARNRVVVQARQPMEPGGINSLESISGSLKASNIVSVDV